MQMLGIFMIYPPLLQYVVVEIYALFRIFYETEKQAPQTCLLLGCMMNTAGSACHWRKVVYKQSMLEAHPLDKSGQFLPLH